MSESERIIRIERRKKRMKMREGEGDEKGSVNSTQKNIKACEISLNG